MTDREQFEMQSAPRLAPGWTAQPAFGFRDPSGITYELNRVYGPAQILPGRPGIEAQRHDEERSYWIATWEEGERTCHRWVTFARARELEGGRLSFARFSTRDDIRESLPRLLRSAAARSDAVERHNTDDPRARRATTTMAVSG